MNAKPKIRPSFKRYKYSKSCDYLGKRWLSSKHDVKIVTDCVSEWKRPSFELDADVARTTMIVILVVSFVWILACGYWRCNGDFSWPSMHEVYIALMVSLPICAIILFYRANYTRFFALNNEEEQTFVEWKRTEDTKKRDTYARLCRERQQQAEQTVREFNRS